MSIRAERATSGSSATRRRLNSGLIILVASLIAGGCGYLVNVLVGATSAAQDYLAFGVFWSALYLFISGLTGIQQEATRATHSRDRAAGHVGTGGGRIVPFAALTSIIVLVVVLATSPLWAGPIFSDRFWAFSIPIAVGSACYVVVGSIVGTMYGLGLWIPIGVMVVTDGVLRLVFVIIVTAFSGTIVSVAWAVVLPIAITPIALVWFIRSRVAGRSQLDVSTRQLTWNVARTMVAAVATGILISGFPLVLTLLSPGVGAARLGVLVFAVNLVRAPLVIVVLALQSYLVVQFREHRSSDVSFFTRLSAALVVVTIVAAAAAAFVVPPVLSALRPEYALGGWFFAYLVATSGILGLLCLSGPLTLARGHHGLYTAGWVIAALVSVAMLLLPGDTDQRMLAALAVGPAIGVAVHLLGLGILVRNDRAKAATGPSDASES